MDDVIKRSDAIKAFCMDCRNQEKPCEYKYTCRTMAVLQDKNKLPSADRPHGYWIKLGPAEYRCSECGKIQYADDSNELNFCCCCGSENTREIARDSRVSHEKGADYE